MSAFRPFLSFLIVCSLAFGYRVGVCQKASPFVLVGANHQATIVLDTTESECVRLAVADLVSDVQKITGQTLKVVSAESGRSYRDAVIVGTVGQSVPIGTYLPDSRDLSGKWENYRVQSVGGNLVLAGSDERGTMFAVYHFIEQYLGVDPLYFWADREPEKRESLRWNDVSITQSTPTFHFRGWFINDEDLLTEWKSSGGQRNIDYPYYREVVNPESMRRVVEGLVRLRQNLIIPASFIDIRNPAEAALVQEATRRGLFVSMHHVEPMGVSAFTYFNYWQEKAGHQPDYKKPLFSYYSERAKVEEVWRVYAQEWAKYPNVIWQVGLRGIADRPMWLADPGIPQSDADRGRIISDAIQTQLALIRQVDKRPDPPVTTTLWAEGSVLNQAGLIRLPNEVITVFADNSPGWRMQADFYETPRLPGRSYGVYYHHQLWGSGPHLAQIVPPSQTQTVLQQVVEKGDTAYAIANVSNLREFVLGADATARMLTDFRSFDLGKFEEKWFGTRYGSSARAVQQVYHAYFDGFALNSQTKTPILMDGQLRRQTLRLLEELRLQLTDSVAYAARQRNKNIETAESLWAKTALADMRDESLTQQALLARTLGQLAAHQRADSLAQLIRPRLNPSQRKFFDQNMQASLDMMLGLEAWSVAIIHSKQWLDLGKRTEAAAALQQAIAAFDRMQLGQKRVSNTDKWQTWYRGDKKMNLPAAKQATIAVRQLLFVKGK